MSFGISVGDIILCSQISHRLFLSVTRGRKRAPDDIKELQDALFGLGCALNVLEREYKIVMTREISYGVTTVQMYQHLGYLIRSCQNTLQELDIATSQYRGAIDNPHAATGYFGKYLRIQWKRIMWSLRGDTFIKYRQRLQMHTDSLHLLLSTFMWLTTGRIEESGRQRERMLSEHLQRVPELNEEIQISVNSLNYAQQNQVIGLCVPMRLTG